MKKISVIEDVCMRFHAGERERGVYHLYIDEKICRGIERAENEGVYTHKEVEKSWKNGFQHSPIAESF